MKSINRGDTRSYQMPLNPMELATSPVQAQPAISQAISSGSTSAGEPALPLEFLHDRGQVRGGRELLLAQRLAQAFLGRRGDELQEEMGVAGLVLVAHLLRVVLADLPQPLDRVAARRRPEAVEHLVVHDVQGGEQDGLAVLEVGVEGGGRDARALWRCGRRWLPGLRARRSSRARPGRSPACEPRCSS